MCASSGIDQLHGTAWGPHGEVWEPLLYCTVLSKLVKHRCLCLVQIWSSTDWTKSEPNIVCRTRTEINVRGWDSLKTFPFDTATTFSNRLGEHTSRLGTLKQQVRKTNLLRKAEVKVRLYALPLKHEPITIIKMKCQNCRLLHHFLSLLHVRGMKK